MAKRNVANSWGAPTLPATHEWEKDMDWYHQAKRVVYKSRGCPKKWEKVWRGWSAYREHGDTEG